MEVLLVCQDYLDMEEGDLAEVDFLTKTLAAHMQQTGALETGQMQEGQEVRQIGEFCILVTERQEQVEVELKQTATEALGVSGKILAEMEEMGAFMKFPEEVAVQVLIGLEEEAAAADCLSNQGAGEQRLQVFRDKAEQPTPACVQVALATHLQAQWTSPP